MVFNVTFNNISVISWQDTGTCIFTSLHTVNKSIFTAINFNALLLQDCFTEIEVHVSCMHVDPKYV